jgi:hypothetical protein
MRTTGVVETEVGRERALKLAHRLVGVQVDVLILDAAPQPLGEHIIDPAPLAVHAHAHALADTLTAAPCPQ